MANEKWLCPTFRAVDLSEPENALGPTLPNRLAANCKRRLASCKLFPVAETDRVFLDVPPSLVFESAQIPDAA